MNKFYLSILIAYFTISCTNTGNRTADANITDSIPAVDNSGLGEDDEDYSEWYKTYLNNYSYEGIKAFEPMAYNESDYSKQLFNIMDTIVGLFKDSDRYYMKKCWIVKTNVYEGKCGDNPVIEPTLNTNEKCLFLFRGLKQYAISYSIDTISIGQKLKLSANDIKDFTFNNVSYRLRAEVTKDYKLYLESDGKSQCLVDIRKHSNTTTEICFIGDLDIDGKPDFIIKSTDSKGNYRLLLFLSLRTEGDDFVKLVSVLADTFAC